MAECKIISCCPPGPYGYVPSFTATATYTATCPEGDTGIPVTVTKEVTSQISYQDAYDQALAQATAEAEAEIECGLLSYPVTIYRTGGIGAAGPLGCGIHYPALTTMAGPGSILISGEGVRASNNYSAYEIQAFDALDRPVFSAVTNNGFDGTNVVIPVDSNNFQINFPCAAPSPPWCGCFAL